MDEYSIYLRKSRIDIEAEARGEGDTLARHRKALLSLARSMGLNVTAMYEEVRSGETIAARPEMQRLLRDVEDGKWAGVLVMEVERLARGNTTDQGVVADTFKYANTKIITPAKVYDPNDEFDEEYFEFGLFMSRREYKTINRRLQRGRRASISEGKYIAGKATYGYERYKLFGEKGYSLRIIPDQAEVVRQIFDWYVNGEPQPDGTLRQLGSFTIAKKLDAQGIPSPTGGKWPACTVSEIIKNATYTGMIRWSHRPTVKRMVDGVMTITRPVHDDVALLPGIHEPLITKETWEAAQKILRSRSHATVPKSTQIRNPLAGLVYCSKCGHSMERRKFQHGSEMIICPNKDCNCKASVLTVVEEAAISGLRLWLADYKVTVATKIQKASSTSATDGEINRLHQSLKSLQKQMDNLYDLLEQGIYTTDVFIRRSQLITEKMETVQQELSRAEELRNSQAAIDKGRFEIIPRIEYVLSTYPTLNDPCEKNRLLKMVLDRTVYSKTKGSRWEESDMQLLIFPKLNPD